MNQTKNLTLTLAFFVLAACISTNMYGQKGKLSKGLNIITPELLQGHVNFLASDALLGRNTPSPGLDTAAAYIVRHFRAFGVQPVGNTFFQPVPLVNIALGEDNSVTITQNGDSKALAIKTQFVPYDITGSGECEGELVFAGFGITAPEYNYDDYQGIDVKGKVVCVMRHEPGENDSTSVFNGKAFTRYAWLDYKMENAINHGAVGMLVLTDPANHEMISPRGFPWPSLSRILPKDALPLVMQNPAEKKIPVVHVGRDIMERMFGSVDSMKNVQKRIDQENKPHSVDFAGITIHLKTTVTEIPVRSQNVIGIVPGTDPVLKNEYVVVGAHYDHVGFKRDHKEGEDYINNGADDNASGTSGMLAVAQAFSKMPKPKRTVIFIAFSAEEKGLYGSKAYVNNPLFPLDKTVAMLNLDMIGRNNIDSLFLEGANHSPDLTEIVKQENEKVGFKLQTDEETYVGRSDHASFYNKNVPFVFFFTGEHPDYHTPRDNPDTVNPKKIARVSQLIFRTAWYLANDDKHYALIK